MEKVYCVVCGELEFIVADYESDHDAAVEIANFHEREPGHECWLSCEEE